MSEEPRSHELAEEFDLDEDLFGFDRIEVTNDVVSDEDLDLDEIFASLEEPDEEALELDEAALEPLAALPADGHPEGDADEVPLEDLFAEHPDDGELIGDSEQPAPAAAPAPSRAAGVARAATTVAHGSRGASSNAAAPATPPPYAGVPTTIHVKQDGPSSRGWIFVMLAVTSINALVALVTVRSTGQMRDSVWESARSVSRTADDIRDGAFEKAEQLNRLILPITAPNAEQHPTFDLARQDIEAGRYADARQRLYALLTIVDRLDESERDEIEARANYLIAQTRHLEAVTTESHE